MTVQNTEACENEKNFFVNSIQSYPQSSSVRTCVFIIRILFIYVQYVLYGLCELYYVVTHTNILATGA